MKTFIPVKNLHDLLDDYFKNEGRITDKRFLIGSQVKKEYEGIILELDKVTLGPGYIWDIGEGANELIN